jgi:hypothetical protein
MRPFSGPEKLDRNGMIPAADSECQLHWIRPLAAGVGLSKPGLKPEAERVCVEQL